MGEFQYTDDWFEIHRESWDRWLRPWIASRQPVAVLELGCHEGRASVWFCDAALSGHPAARLTCVDSWSQAHGKYFPIFASNIARTGCSRQVEIRTGTTADVLPVLPAAAYDLIYVDAGHHKHEVIADTLEARRLVAPGGWILWDDYAHELAGVPYLPAEVIAGVAEAMGAEAERVEIVDAVARWQAP